MGTFSPVNKPNSQKKICSDAFNDQTISLGRETARMNGNPCSLQLKAHLQFLLHWLPSVKSTLIKDSETCTAAWVCGDAEKE